MRTDATVRYLRTAAVLLGAGMVTIRAAIKNDRNAIALSIFPVLFGLHQITEGLIWHFSATGQDLGVLSHIYIYVAFLLWPITIPIASILAEKYKQRRLLLAIPALTGVFVTFYSGWQLLLTNGIDVLMVGHSLRYQVNYEDMPGIWLNYLYAFSVVVPLILNSRKMIKVFGLSVLSACVFSFVMLREVYFSVWCIMSAWLSLLIYFTIERTDSRVVWNSKESDATR